MDVRFCLFSGLFKCLSRDLQYKAFWHIVRVKLFVTVSYTIFFKKIQWIWIKFGILLLLEHSNRKFSCIFVLSWNIFPNNKTLSKKVHVFYLLKNQLNIGFFLLIQCYMLSRTTPFSTCKISIAATFFILHRRM